MQLTPNGPARKPYAAPKLLELGAVETLTGQNPVGTSMGIYEEKPVGQIPTDGKPFGS